MTTDNPHAQPNADETSDPTPRTPGAQASWLPTPAGELTWIGTVWDTHADPLVPTMLTRNDGRCLLYPGKAHTIVGAPGTGKSWLALATAAQLLRTGEQVFYIDWEATEHDIIARLRALGVSREQVRGLAYLRLDTSRLGEAMDWLLDQLAQHRPQLVVLDGLASAMALAGLDENNNSHAARWHQQVIVPITDTGAATLTIDHLAKDSLPAAARRSVYARGASAKLADITGAAYLLSTVQAFSREVAGCAWLYVMKDRHGQVGAQSEVVAHIRFAPVQAPTEGTIPGTAAEANAGTGPGGRLAVEVLAPPARDVETAQLRADILRVLTAQGPMNRTSLRKVVRGKNILINTALDQLLAEQQITSTPHGAAKLLSINDTTPDAS